MFNSAIFSEYPLLSCNSEASTIDNISSTSTSNASTICNSLNRNNYYSENVPSSIGASLFDLGIRNDSSNEKMETLNGNISFIPVNDWSLLKDYQLISSLNTSKSDCSSTASTSSSNLTPTLNPVTLSLNSGLGVKRPSSTIGIAQRNGIILSPINNLDNQNCLQSDAPLNKIKKLENVNSEILK